MCQAGTGLSPPGTASQITPARLVPSATRAGEGATRRASPIGLQPAARPPDGRLAALSSSPIVPLWAPPPPCDPPPASPFPLHDSRSRRHSSTGHALVVLSLKSPG